MAIQTIRIEAESMKLINYRLESNASASGGQIISLSNGASDETGYASYTFADQAGLYDVVVGYYDENDGVAQLGFQRNNTVLDSWSLNKDLGSNAANSQTFLRRTVAKGISIRSGEVFQIKSLENKGEYARIDYIEFIPIAVPIRVEAESMKLTNYRTQSNTSASGGKLISLLNGASNETGYASYTFAGSSGLYDVVVGYYDENDGVAQLEVKRSNTVLDSWSSNQNLGSDSANSQTFLRRTVGKGISIAAGEVFQIKGVENKSEPARIDYIEFIPVSTTPTPTSTPPLSNETGNGLFGVYFNAQDFADPVLARTDKTINFDWTGILPAWQVNKNSNFSVHWTGQIKPLFSEKYTFYTFNDDGIRLWINNQLIIDRWFSGNPNYTEVSGYIDLIAGQKYDIKLEYNRIDDYNFAVAQLSWSSASQTREIVPQSQLFSYDTLAPRAILSAANFISNGATGYEFSVTYKDATAVDIKTLDTGDIQVTGPNGFSQIATFVGVSSSTNGNNRTATYRITNPQGAWNSFNVGTYTINVQSNQVSDTLGNTISTTTLGSFNLSLTPPLVLPGVSTQPTPTKLITLPTGADVFNLSIVSTVTSTSTNQYKPMIAEWTRTAAPGDTIVLTGSQLSQLTGSQFGNDTKFWVYGQTKANDGVLVQAQIQKLDANTAAITLPTSLPKGSEYVLWAANTYGASQPVLINRTEAWWVGPDAATRGQVTSIFGRNLSQGNNIANTNVYIEDALGKGYWAEVVAVNPYKIDFKVPSALVNGDYKVWVHNGNGGQYGWSEQLKLTVNNGFNYTGPTFNVKNFGAVGNGITDDTQAIKKAINEASKYAMSTVYFPTGNYVLSEQIWVWQDQGIRYLGDGKDLTTIKAANGFNQDYMFQGSGANNITFQNLSLDANYQNAELLTHVTHLRFDSNIQYLNVRIRAEGTTPFDWHGSTGIFMKNSEIIGQTGFIGTAQQVFIDDTQFFGTDYVDTLLQGFGVKMLSITNSIGRNLDNSDPSNGKWVKGRFFVDQSHWANSSYQYLGNNKTIDLAPPPVDYVDQNSGEQILWETLDSEILGAITTSTKNTVSVTSPSTIYNEDFYLTIVAGQGMGQTRLVKSFNSATNTYEIESTWNVLPNNSSSIVASRLPSKIIVYGNQLDGTAQGRDSGTASSGVQAYHGASDLIIDNNTFHELGTGVSLWSGVDGYLRPAYFTQVTNNTFVDNLTGMLFRIDPSTSQNQQTNIMGSIFRNNYVDNNYNAISMNYNYTIGMPDANMNIIEKNSLNKITQFIDTGSMSNNNANNILLQNNFLQNNFLESDFVQGNLNFNTVVTNIFN